MFQIFKKKINYKKSTEYKIKLNQIKNKGITSRGHKNIQELDMYFNNLSQVFKDMKKSGYKNQNRLPNKRIGDEIGVFLGPKGEIVKAEDKFRGTHRFAMSKILNLKYVYINVRAVDFKFLEKFIFNRMSINDDQTVFIKKIKFFLKKYQ